MFFLGGGGQFLQVYVCWVIDGLFLCQKEVFCFCFFEGFDYYEIFDIMKIFYQVVCNYVFCGMKCFRVDLFIDLKVQYKSVVMVV